MRIKFRFFRKYKFLRSILCKLRLVTDLKKKFRSIEFDEQNLICGSVTTDGKGGKMSSL